MAAPAIIRASHLCKSYNSGKEHYHAIRNVDLSIFEGEFTVIMGNSGSGKSTLLYLLSGLDQASSGEVYFREQRIDRFKERELADFRTRNIGYIYQSINLVPDLSIVDNIALPGYIAGSHANKVKEKAASLMQAMGIDSLALRLPAQISGGQQQRAAIARAMINAPDVIFADEPTGSLNYDHGIAVLDLLTDMNRKGQSVVMVTHDMKAAARADRLIYIRDGKVSGELAFGKYEAQDSPEREALIFSFVAGRG